MDVTIDLGVPTDRVVIALRGELDVHSASALREAVQCLLESTGEDLIVDASGVRVADEAGRATLNGIARHLREFGGQLRAPVDAPLP